MKRDRTKWQGMKWLRLSTRMAVYHRDGFVCAYCGSPGEEYGVGLTVDHIVAVDNGGTNEPGNCITCCFRCNSAKGAMTKCGWLSYLRKKGIDSKTIARRIRVLTRKKLNREEGRRLARMRKDRIKHTKELKNDDGE